MAIEKLAGLKIVVAGGDEREKVLALELAKQGAKVWLYGFSRGNKYLLENLSFGLPPRADVIILPLSGLDEDGNFRAAGGQKKNKPRTSGGFVFPRGTLDLRTYVPPAAGLS